MFLNKIIICKHNNNFQFKHSDYLDALCEPNSGLSTIKSKHSHDRMSKNVKMKLCEILHFEPVLFLLQGQNFSISSF